MKRYLWLCVIGCSLVLGTLRSASAAVNVFDLESRQGIAAWNLRTPATDTLALLPKYATDGKLSIEFTTPTYHSGMQRWPAFESKPLVGDWRAFDRLVVDVTNPTGSVPCLVSFISDDKIPFRSSFTYNYIHMPARGFRRYVIDLKTMPEKVDKSRISLMHFFLDAPPTSDLKLYISNVVLLKPGEPEPPISQKYVSQIRPLFRQQSMKKARTVLDKCLMVCTDKNQIAKLTRRYSSLNAVLNSKSVSSYDIAGFVKKADTFVVDCQRIYSIESLRKTEQKLGIPTDTMLVGFVPSTEKVLPRDMSSDLRASHSVSISAARNERESFQVAVTPSGSNALKGVKVAVSDLRSKSGETLSKSNINCDVVGYVQTKNMPPYAVPYIGWWPDPILSFLGPVDIKLGDVQTFWVRVRVPKDQKAGVYNGKLAVYSGNGKPINFAFSVKVRSFKMPDCSPLPTAMTFLGRYDKKAENIIKMGGREYWDKQLKYTWADFLASYKMGFDDIYAIDPPDYDVLKYLHDKGELVAFNLGQYYSGNDVARIKPIYDKCKDMGLIDHTYTYGFDEVPAEQFQSLEDAAGAMKKAFPDVLTMTTAIDLSYGQDTIVKSVDAWVPLTPNFDAEKAPTARAAGKKVWWYVCAGPYQPYANMLIEYDTIETRLLMGAMTAKYRPDGFLYYSTTIWNANKPIESGPFTNWNPVSFADFHGDGNLMYRGAKGMPVPSIRLENFRDGMEDFAYAKILEDIIGKYEAKGESLTASQRKWLTGARAALAVPEKLVKTMTDYSHDTRVLYAWRERVADYIDASGMVDADPWGKDFGVRGFVGK